MYNVGWGKQRINIQARGYAMFGYGQWQHRAKGEQSSLFARAICIQNEQQAPVIICCLDMGCITHAMRSEASKLLSQKLATDFDDSAFMLTATHTHSAPGGCAYEALYNMPTPGFVPEHLNAVVQAIVEAVMQAWHSRQPTTIQFGSEQFKADIPVAWNRSLAAYNRNPDVSPRSIDETHLALDRHMNLLGFYRDGKLSALLSLFGVHATCVGSTLHKHSGDNKGYAAEQTENWLVKQGIEQPIAIFAQGSAGDVSPHYQGKTATARRKKLNGPQVYAYAQRNGSYQSDLALNALSQPILNVEGVTDSILGYRDFSHIHVKSEFTGGNQQAFTSDPCHGAAFFAGTPIDGPGTAAPITKAMQLSAHAVRKLRLSPLMRKHNEAAYYQQLYASQGPKAIVLEAGKKRILGRALGSPPGIIDPLIAEMNRQVAAGAINESPLVPSVLPLQMIRIGQIALLACPGEITTTAGKRLVDTVRPVLQAQGIEQVLLCSYCNDYMGYITTYEEYQEQAYEGGHTLFGQWTLAAFQTCFEQLAKEFVKPEQQREHDQHTQPPIVPKHELALRTNTGNLKTAVS
ncbi:neutral/alkaline non-lysosomal ceramidase N-terminal domain-containing protein [Alkanindiges sp. WGS2144]|uniref:neutral/alkaline non-lysosomal ceramidase N-terminal domain-containing protein n=1 Tax=Alkanindiges sp. WGS2144 TaxID=3366808 RepID=UPI00375145D7